MARTIEKCRACGYETLTPVTVHSIWESPAGHSLYAVMCDKCHDFVPVKLPTFDIGGTNPTEAIKIWNEYQLSRDALIEAMKGPAKNEDGKES